MKNKRYSNSLHIMASKPSFVFSIYFYLLDFVFYTATQNFLDMKPCPQLYSKYKGTVDQLLGDWHIALAIMDETGEIFEERSLCIQGRISKLNSTTLIQTWFLEMPEVLHEARSEIDFPTTILLPGVWLVHSPLGGTFKGTIVDTDGVSYVLIMYCGWTDDSSAHMMTIAMSRSHIVTPKQKLQLLSVLHQNGYDPFRNKVISWSDCTY